MSETIPSAHATGKCGAEGLAVSLTVNGYERTLLVEPRTTLLTTLRDESRLTGTKKGCDRGRPTNTILLDRLTPEPWASSSRCAGTAPSPRASSMA
jgi:aerobic-type carbon monoxide dehydrogenase small subunit (CoxS/CutS family)